MKKRILNKSICKIDFLTGIYKNVCSINLGKKPTLVGKTKSFISSKSYKLLINNSVLRKSVTLLSKINTNIGFANISKLHKNKNILVLKFIPSNKKYDCYSKLITDNIETIYELTSVYFTEVYQAILNKLKIKSKEQRFDFTEEAFDLVLFKLNQMNLKTKEDITEEIIIDLIVDYVYSKLK